MEHLINNTLLNTPHPITITLVGCGGTGCAVLRQLGQMDASLRQLGHNGLHVTVMDDDTVMPHNVGRQSIYSKSDVGEFKGAIAVTRINRFYGLQWEFVPERYSMEEHTFANILISCVDNMKGRQVISAAVDHIRENGQRNNNMFSEWLYWLDFGNDRDKGQVVLGTVQDKQLPHVLDMFPLMALHEKEEEPSCSMEESLAKQDLFINSFMANAGCNILWQMLRNTGIENHGCFLNISQMIMRPIKVKNYENSK